LTQLQATIANRVVLALPRPDRSLHAVSAQLESSKNNQKQRVTVVNFVQ
jgi:hypothetical protein